MKFKVAINSVLLMTCLQAQLIRSLLEEDQGVSSKTFSASESSASCNEHLDHIFVKNFLLADSVQIYWDHSLRPNRESDCNLMRTFSIFCKIFLVNYRDHSTRSQYNGASIFFPTDLNFNDAFTNQKRKYHNPAAGVTAYFHNDREAEVISCLEPLQGLILLSSNKNAPDSPPYLEFVIENVPPSSTIQFYVLFVVDARNEVARKLITIDIPTKAAWCNKEKIELGRISDHAIYSDITLLNFPSNFSQKLYALGEEHMRQLSDNIQRTKRASSENNNTSSDDMVLEKRMAGIINRSSGSTINNGAAKEYLDHMLPDYLIHVNRFYSGCGVNYSCFEDPPHCHHSKDCTINLRFGIVDQVIQMVITASASKWVAVGFSLDEYMGDDAIVICRRIPNSSKVSLWDAYSPPRPDSYSKGAIIHAQSPYLSGIVGSYYNGVLSCEFALNTSFTTESNLNIDFLKTQYHLLLAIGIDNTEPRETGTVGYHAYSVVSKEAVNVAGGPTIVHKQGMWLIAFHEYLAISTYAFMFPAGILISRYGQQGLHSPAVRSYPTWFINHVGLLVLATVCNLVSAVIIYACRSGSAFYTESSTYHGIVGPIAFLLSFVNVGVGFFLYLWKRENDYPFLKWTHYIVGHVGALLGAVEIIRGPYIPKSEISCSFSVIAGFNYLFFAGANILLMFNTEHIRHKQESREPSFRSFWGPALNLKLKVDKAMFAERRYIIFFTMCILFVCTAILILEAIFSDSTCCINSVDYI